LPSPALPINVCAQCLLAPANIDASALCVSVYVIFA